MRRIVAFFLAVLVVVGCIVSASAADVIYSTKDCDWIQISEFVYGADTDGDGSYDITLTKQGDNWVYDFVVQDDDASYYVWEDDVPNNYEIVGNGSRVNPVLSEIQDGINQAVIVNRSTNNVLNKYKLELSKVAVNELSEKSFGFDIVLESDTPGEIVGVQMFGNVRFADGKSSVYLKSGESVIVSDIPEGVKYTVTEQNSEGYFVTWNDVNEGNSISGVMTSDVNLMCRNNKESVPSVTVTDLLIKKEAKGEVKGEFQFRLVLWGLNPDISYVFNKGAQNVNYEPDSSGMAVVDFSLGVGDVAVFKNLPVGSIYQVVEFGNDYSSEYVINNVAHVVSSQGEIGGINQDLMTARETLAENENPEVVFINKSLVEDGSDTVNVSVSKVWKDNDKHDGVTVYLKDDGEVVGSVILDEYNNWTGSFTGLSKFRADGVTPCEYMVEEKNVSGYVSTVEKKSEYVFEIINKKSDVGSVTISKMIEHGDKLIGTENEDLLDMNFEFEILLSNDMTEQYYYDGDRSGYISFKNGKGSLLLKHGETVCIHDIPNGIKCTVDEIQYDKFIHPYAQSFDIKGDIRVDFVNKINPNAGIKLPGTGGPGVFGFVMIGIGLLSVGIVVVRVAYRRCG